MSSPTDPETFRTAMLRFVNEVLLSQEGKPNARTEPVVAGTSLFETNLLDSLSILSLIARIEELTGKPLPDNQVTMKNFRSIETITQAFCHEICPS